MTERTYIVTDYDGGTIKIGADEMGTDNNFVCFYILGISGAVAMFNADAIKCVTSTKNKADVEDDR